LIEDFVNAIAFPISQYHYCNLAAVPDFSPMRQHLKYLSLVTANLLFCLTFSLLPTAYFLFPFPIKAQTVQSQNAEAEKLYEEATQQYRDGRYREAIQTYQQALVIYRKIGDRSW
jgi:tetratricopeptide (TPR) repeat protein